MEKFNHLDEVPLAELTQDQLNILQTTEMNLSQQGEKGEVYLIAFRKSNSE